LTGPGTEGTMVAMDHEGSSMTSRLLLGALLGAARIAANRLVPLKQLKQLVELAYYREARRRGLKMREMRDLMAVSMSKVGLLSKDLKAWYSEPYREHELPQRILNLLWAGPLSEHAIGAALDDAEPEEVAGAIRKLVDAGELMEEPGRTVVRYRLTRQAYRRVEGEWMARVSAANDVWRTAAMAVEARFLAGDDRAMARTLHFRAREDDLPELKAAYERHIFPLVCELDARVTADEPSVGIHLSYVVAPEPEGHDPAEDEP
jgi:hypothetical protein